LKREEILERASKWGVSDGIVSLLLFTAENRVLGKKDEERRWKEFVCKN
jgi:hypothetical protein